MKIDFSNKKWLYPGIGIKRWILLLTVSLLLISAGITILLGYQIISYLEIMIIRFLFPFVGNLSFFIDLIVAITLIILGIWGIFTSMKGALKGFYQLEAHEFLDKAFERKILEKGPRIVALGGGTGLSNLLRGLKKYTSNLTAVVTVADDGGSSGKLRDELGILPPGDIRNCLVALADTEPLMEELFQYRFNSGGDLEGHSFGNLFIASLTEILGDFEEAIRESSKVLAIRGKVLPATNEDIRLGAIYSDKTVLLGESIIPEQKKKIDRVFLQPSSCKPSPEVLKAIEEAEIIVVGPGSLYTSIIPNLLVGNIADKIRESKAIRIFVCNVMTQAGETTGYSVSDHIKAIYKHTGPGLFDYVVVNKEESSRELIKRYREEGAFQVEVDKRRIKEMGIKIIEGNLLSSEGYIRHDPDELAKVILGVMKDR
ncbi:MAG: uridine diphosphate-N-acetylglucosamine-binding protein YvcK [Halanaerobiales bacterium]